MPDGKPTVEGYGKIALVLNREPSGEWKVKQEMWNDAPAPQIQQCFTPQSDTLQRCRSSYSQGLIETITRPGLRLLL